MPSLGLTLAAASKPSSSTIDLKPTLHAFLHFAVAIWPLWILLAFVAAAKLGFAIWDERRLARSGIREVDVMDGKTFEEFLAARYRRLGYDVELTGYRGDFGADLVIAKDGIRTAVQAKRWSRRVGLKAVQEVVGAKAYYRCERATVVANRAFTDQARRLAAANDVTLWDRDVLIAHLLETTPRADAAPALAAKRAVAASAVDEPAVCAACGATLSDKVRDYCVAHTARFDGRLYCYSHQRRRPSEPRLAD